MFMYSYCYVCSALGIVFRCVVLCTVCVKMCTVLLPPSVNPIAVIIYIISNHSAILWRPATASLMARRRRATLPKD